MDRVLGHSLVRLLVRSHRSLIHLLRTARFAHALRCAHSFARSLAHFLTNASTSYSFNPLCIDRSHSVTNITPFPAPAYFSPYYPTPRRPHIPFFPSVFFHAFFFLLDDFFFFPKSLTRFALAAHARSRGHARVMLRATFLNLSPRCWPP